MSSQTTRDHIIEAADRLFYRHGFEHTSFSDIAEVVRISRGNFYYHFKSKDDILDAVIDFRLATTKAMLETWELEATRPADRIRSFIDILMRNRADIKRYGCPVGTLCRELAKLNHASQAQANALLTLFRAWLRRQFVLLGRKADADALAMHLLARSQGVAVLAGACGDAAFIEREVRQMRDWLDTFVDSAARSDDAEPAGRRRGSHPKRADRRPPRGG